MDIDRYQEIKKSRDAKIFTFISNGHHGQLIKMVSFVQFTTIPQTYNLALGTVRGQKVNYEETTDNGDRDKILATVFHIARTFSSIYPDQKIFARGRDKLTTRLYRGAINHSYDLLNEEFIIYGGIYQASDNKYNFEILVGTKLYDAFLFERR